MKVLVFLAGIGLLSAGPATMTVPELAANAYGIPLGSDEALGYLRATAIRDVALGCWLLAMLFLGSSFRILAFSVFSIAVVALGDAINVLLHAGSSTSSMLVHVGGLVVLVALGLALWRSPPPTPK
jgi:Domain of unknown function (DUF4267)